MNVPPLTIPAKAGIQFPDGNESLVGYRNWAPAFAGVDWGMRS